ncbi:hypothetical protein EXIGLDRAFT_714872 [Exidia glandulosa HHB12029]|uniref:Uncharacterized protein n=1 Tax=Exidia glandulosa HHB12029 TaxID=1314781 RepID=A0A165PNZ6_EXIGL|nr:hypothetical protein EXIGLDRAFT_714872 [Exidia glandulosa HHB12029]
MTSSASQHFASFAAYTPPPDDPSASRNQSASRPWFPAHASSSPSPAGMSYQAGGIPTFATAQAGPSHGRVEEGLNPTNLWETRFGWRVDVLAAVAYVGGPFTALALLILETTNDYVRFHAYQSALVSSPLLLLLFLEHLIGLPAFFTILTTIIILFAVLYLAFRAYQDAAIGDLARFQVPYAGELADRWVSDE